MELKFNNPNTKVGYDAVFKNRPVITPKSFEEAAEKYIHNLKDVITEKSIYKNNKPILMLSGGVDSSVIALAALKNIPNLTSYIAVHDEKSKDLKCAREVSEMLNIELVEVKVEPPTVDDVKDIINTIEMNYKAQIEIAWPCICLLYTSDAADE